MAITDELRAQILRWHFVEHWRVGTIARQLGVHHSTVERVLGERGAEVEAHEGVSGVAQHQDERHQGAFGASDGELSEVRPVDLSLLARKGAKAQIRFTGPARAQLRDAVTEVVGGRRCSRAP